MPRLSVNINEETALALHQLHEETGLSYTELVRRAIGSYSFLKTEVVPPTTLELVNKRNHSSQEIELV